MMNKFGKELGEFLECKNISIKEFADRINTTSKNLIDIIKGNIELSQNMIYNISFITDIPVNYIENVEKKSKIAEDYIQIWNTDFLPKQKEFKGINIEELQASIEKLARETKLENLAINFSPVVLAGKDLSKQTIKVYTTLVSIRFTSITDINFFMFLDNLKDEIGYFITIQDINLKRVGKVNQEMLDALSIGNIVTNVEGDVKVRVYGLGKGRD